MLVLMLTFMLVGCNQNEQMDEMAQKIAQLEQSLQEQADILEEKLNINNSLYEKIDEQEEKLAQQEETIDKQQAQIKNAEKAIDNLMGKPIEFTAQAPVYDFSALDGYERIKYFDLYPSEDKSNFESFMDYYNTEFREAFDEKHFLLKCSETEVPYGNQIYSVCAQNIDGEYVKPIICDLRRVRDEAINSYEYYTYVDGGIYGLLSTVELNIYLVPLPEEYYLYDYWRGDLRLVFGRGEENKLDYFNIYIDRTCIGTCYYETHATLTYRWFERYFQENLFIGE